jgi:hypothetical protein
MGKLAAPVRADKEMMFTNRQLVALMWPLLLEQFLAITVGLADSLMVATVGDAAISAVSLVDSISNLMIYIFSAMATGGAAVAGQYIGQRQKEDACNAGQQLIALLGAVSVFFVALLYLFRTQILTVMFGHIEPDVMAATNTYYLYVMASIPGIALYNGGAALFRTMGHSDVSLKVSLLMNSINVIGNAVLIFGFGMDVAGVAIPTLVSRTVAAVVILSLLFNRDLMLHLSDIRGFRVDMRLMKNIFYIGVPSGVENGMFQLERRFPKLKDALPETERMLRDLGINDNNTYLYIQGHHLFDLVVCPLVQSVCDTLRNVRENEIRDRAVHSEQARTEMACYENSLGKVKMMMKKNTFYQFSPEFQKIQADVAKYLEQSS